MSFPSLKALALADDTTGALEVGAGFAQAGVGAQVVIQPEPELTGRTTALVVDTRSRRLTPPQAYERLLRLGHAARRLGIVHLFKKTDSTLRGNIGAEFRGLLEAWPEAVLLYVPAYPRMGRTVVNGSLYVNGFRLGETPFANDPLNPSRESRIPAVLAEACAASIKVAGAARIAGLLREVQGGSILVCDGAADEDLESAAAAVAQAGRALIVAGTGGFSSWWIRSLGIGGLASPGVPPVERCLVVSGSQHPRSGEQVWHAQEGGIPVRRLSENGEEDGSTARLLESWLAVHRWCVLAAPDAPVGLPDVISARLARMARRVIETGHVDGLIVFGGDTALNILDAAGVESLQPLGEILHGVPASRFDFAGRSLLLITKAGGFGTPDVILEIKRKLEKVE